jgi:hypothetical protein
MDDTGLVPALAVSIGTLLVGYLLGIRLRKQLRPR